ncbi:MAG: hypothetical protein AAFQ95_21055 [Cyanobacteria bacterium J06621_3]
MLLPLQQLKHANAITHEGKLLLFATDNSGKIWYSVKQDGFEDNALEQTTQIKGWENWQTLELPADENPDQSVLEKEKAELTRQDDDERYLLRSRYYTIGESALAPVQLVSGMGHLYVFASHLQKLAEWHLPHCWSIASYSMASPISSFAS